MDGMKPPGPDMTPWERSWGIRYLLFQLIFLPQILVLLNALAGGPLSTPWLNVVFFTVNFGAVGWIFRDFWRKTLQELPQTWKKSLALAALDLWRWSRFWAYAISAAVFCAVHVLSYVGRYEPALLALNFLQYLPAGLILAWAYEKSGSILCPILIHMGVNALGMASALGTH